MSIPFISVVIPVYNEQRAVSSTINTIKEVMSKSGQRYEIIAVNDGSKDRSRLILEKIRGIKVINHPYNLGYGASLKTGIRAAKGTHILITDADGTYPIRDIPALLKHMNHFDMVVGARTGKLVKIPLLRKPAKAFLNMMANFLTNKRIPDLNSGFRIFKKEIAEKFFNLFPAGFSFTTTITLACLTNGYTVKYIPINYYRRQGKSTIHPFNDFVGFIALMMRVTTYFKPFKFFFTISAALFILSVIIYFYSVLALHRLMDVTVIIVFLASLQIFLFGLIADLIVKGRK